MTVRNKKLQFKKAMLWEPEIEQLLNYLIQGDSLNICSGESKIGKRRLDIVKKENVTDIGDMSDLPFENESFDSVISDPPWGINFYKRMRPFFEAVRVCRVGGLIVYNATWIPESKAVELLEVYVRKSASFGNVSVLCVFRKTTNQHDGDSSALSSQNVIK